jgi:predicted nucleotidyltransferase
MCNKNQLEEIERRIAEIAVEKLGDKLDSVLLYGSYARGDYDSDSDIDIMIIADISADEANHLEEALIKFTTRLDLEFDVIISLYVKDKSNFYKWSNVLPFYKNVIREGVSLIA